MKLAILSCNRHCYSSRRLREAAVDRGHKVKVLNTLRFSIDLEEGRPSLNFRSKELSHYDAVLPRIGASITYFGTAVVRQFEQMDVFCANSSAGISNSRDKLRSLQILSRHKIGMPPTTFVRDKKDVLPAIERVGGAPVIIKLLEGTQGVGVILADSVKIAEAIIETLQSTKQNVLVQKFVAESKGRDIRAFVVGDQVVAAMRRVAQGQEFRSNVHRGGQTEPVELDEEFTANGDPRRPDSGVAGRRRRHARRQGRSADHGGELVARPRRHRDLHPTRHRRGDRRLHRRPGRLPRNRYSPATDRQPRLRRRRDLHSRGIRLRRQEDQANRG